jgi:hypothetical protein
VRIDAEAGAWIDSSIRKMRRAKVKAVGGGHGGMVNGLI